MARDMVLRYGIDEGLGPVTYADAPLSPLLGEASMPSRAEHASPQPAQRIDAVVQGLLQPAHEQWRSCATTATSIAAPRG
jgi:cell division protease FtsH